MSAKTSISELDLICNQSQQAKIELRRSKKSKKDDALKYAAEFLILNKAKLIDANSIDMELAHQKDLQDSFIDRLELNEKRIESMISGLEKVINLQKKHSIFTLAFAVKSVKKYACKIDFIT